MGKGKLLTFFFHFHEFSFLAKHHWIIDCHMTLASDPPLMTPLWHMPPTHSLPDQRCKIYGRSLKWISYRQDRRLFTATAAGLSCRLVQSILSPLFIWNAKKILQNVKAELSTDYKTNLLRVESTIPIIVWKSRHKHQIICPIFQKSWKIKRVGEELEYVLSSCGILGCSWARKI